MIIVTDYTVLLKNAHETELPDIITNVTEFIAISQKEQIPRNFLSIFSSYFSRITNRWGLCKTKIQPIDTVKIVCTALTMQNLDNLLHDWENSYSVKISIYM